MKFEKIEWRNIFSYGNKIETLEFGNKGQLWQLAGRSGSGKSSLLAIPKILLYGKTEGSDGKLIKIGNIANRINKNGWIKGTIKKGKDIFIIERTFSPQSLIVYKNGENLEKSGLKDMQSIIDNEIMDNLPYHIFSNVMSLSLNNFKSFISMTPDDKRLIIDKIFSLELINKVYDLIKKDMKDLGSNINISNSQIFMLEQTLKTSKKELENLSKKDKDNNKNSVKILEERLTKIKELFDNLETTYNLNYNKYLEINNEDKKIRLAINNETNECNHIVSMINLFNEDKCPTCGVSFKSDQFLEIKETLRDKLNKQYEKINMYNNTLSSIIEAENKLNIYIIKLKENIEKIVQKRNEITAEFKTLENSKLNNNEYKSIQNIINNTQIKKTKLETDINKSNNNMNLLQIMKDLYSNEGIKKRLMENYLPTLNEEIKNTLISLSFPYTLEFDSNFNPRLEDLNEPIEVQSLSAGEHKKLDLTVLCSILKMIKRKYPQLNLVCLDETISSLDYESSTDIILHLQEIAENMNLNIFIVSHTVLDENLFDVKININKNSGFSDLTFV